MATTSGSNVYLAVPVYHGADFVAGSLGSMLRQTHRDVTVMISVDGNDRESASACEPFLADERVRMVVQDVSWAGSAT